MIDVIHFNKSSWLYTQETQLNHAKPAGSDNKSTNGPQAQLLNKMRTLQEKIEGGKYSVDVNKLSDTLAKTLMKA